MDTLNLSAYRGDTFPQHIFAITDSQSEPLDLSDIAAIDFQIKKVKGGDSVLNYSLSSGVTINNALSGIFQIDESIINIAPAIYYHDLSFTWNDGRIETILKGTFTVEQDV